jgi:hypothetical protein
MGGKLVRPGAIAFAEQVDFALLFFYRAFHLASAGSALMVAQVQSHIAGRPLPAEAK